MTGDRPTTRAAARAAAAPAPLATPVGDAAVLLGALLIALLPLVPVFGPPVAVPALGGAAAGALVALVAARRRWSALGTSAAGVGAYLLLGGALAVPTSTLWGVLPTPGTVTSLLTGAVTVWKQVLTLDPVVGGGTVLVAPFLLALLGSTGALSIAWRGPAPWAALVPPAVGVAALLLGTKESVVPLVGVVVAIGLLGWVARRRGTLDLRRPVAALAVVGLAAGVGVAAGPWLAQDRPRFVLRDELVPPFDPDAQPSPLAAYRKFVKEWRDTPLFTVVGLPEDTPVRLAVMDAYDGVVWTVAGHQATSGSGSFRRVGGPIPVSERGTEVTVALEVHHLPFVWLPTVGYAMEFLMLGSPTTSAAELAADLRYNDATGAAVLTSGVPDGAVWQVRTVVPDAVGADDVGTAAAGDLRLPDVVVPDAARAFAVDVAGTATTPVLIAAALEQGLRDRGWLSHGLVEQGEHPSLSGHGVDRLTTLLTGDLMVGDEEQYAAAMAVMARELGLPARVVLGFVPESAAEVTVTGADVSAWVEIQFAGYGWVGFRPTPERTLTIADDEPQTEAAPQPQVVQPPPGPEDPVKIQDVDPEQAGVAHDGEIARAPDSTALLAVGAGVAGALLLALPFALVIAAKERRRRRRRTRGDGVDRVVGGWDEVLDHAVDLRVTVPARATRREIAVGLTSAFGDRPGVRDELDGLASRADAAVFAAGAPRDGEVEDYWGLVDTTIATLRTTVPRRRRVGSRFTLRSLRRSRAGARAGSPVR